MKNIEGHSGSSDDEHILYTFSSPCSFVNKSMDLSFLDCKLTFQCYISLYHDYYSNIPPVYAFLLSPLKNKLVPTRDRS